MIELIDDKELEKKGYSKDRFLSDKIRWYVYAIFFIGLILTFLHWPGSTLIILAAILGILLSIGQLMEAKIRDNYTKGITDVIINLIMIYAIFRLQYWKSASFIFLIAAGFVGVGVLRHLNGKVKKKRKQIIVLSLIFCTLVLHQIPQFRVFYAMNLTETFHSHNREHAHSIWEKYAWFQWWAGDHEGAGQSYYHAVQISHESGNDDLAFHYSENFTKLKDYELEWSDIK
ncbi:MAG: hypothetical protein QNK23_02715 [Crocinitomicaceae bacterium]|nr:hypothetical protein [Crocinitomicaceae bacterium]